MIARTYDDGETFPKKELSAGLRSTWSCIVISVGQVVYLAMCTICVFFVCMLACFPTRTRASLSDYIQVVSCTQESGPTVQRHADLLVNKD
jgi:hypothetical protein